MQAMKAIGIIVEYNPLHNGHQYHLEKSKKRCGADFVVCVMSGNFVQRGEPAVMNKWARTKTALLSGADLIIELPFVFATASAEYFSYGAVKILDSLGIIDHICFGSESGNIEELDTIAAVLTDEPEAYKSHLKHYLDEGLSYPAAREKALQGFFNSYVPHIGKSIPHIKDIVGSSNNILGIEYIKALKRLKSKINPVTISRMGSTYNDRNLNGQFSSASAIRQYIIRSCRCDTDGGTDSDQDCAQGCVGSSSICSDTGRVLEGAMPPASVHILHQELQSGRCPVSMDSFENIILANLRRMSKEEIKKLPYVAEGMENRIKAAARSSGSLDELLESIDTKRYTRTRIQRCLISMLGGLSSEELDTFMEHGGPRYIRALGFNKKGRQLLSEIRKKATLPVIVKAADFKRSDDPLLERMLEIEAVSTDMYVLGYANPEFRKAGQEFTQNIIRIDQ